MNPSFPTKTVKKKSRNEKEFRVFKTGNYLSLFKIFIPSVIILFISNSKIF
jgi:hypothetical protein